MTTIVVLFQSMRGRQFKSFYRGTVCRFMASELPCQLFLHLFCGIVAALRRSAGGLVCHTQGCLHGHFHCGWFYGFKLPAVISHRGELLAIASSLFGKLYAVKCYIGKESARKMKDQDIDVVTRVHKNMKKIVHSEFDRVLLRKRSLVKTVFIELKNLCQIEHTRHRSLSNFAVNLMAGIVA